MVPQTTYVRSRGKYGEYNPLVIGTVQRTGFSEKIHTADQRRCRTTDDVLSSILDNDADQDTNNLFMKFGPRNDWKSVAVGHIVQVNSTVFCISFYQFFFIHPDVTHCVSLHQPDGLVDVDVGLFEVLHPN